MAERFRARPTVIACSFLVGVVMTLFLVPHEMARASEETEASACACVCPATADAATDATPTIEASSTPATATDAEPSPTAENPTAPAATAPPDVVFSEIFPDPVGSDAGAEWFELWDRGATAADLTGWTVATASGRMHVLAAVTLAPGAYRYLVDAESGVPLANDGGTLRLVSPDGVVIAEMTWPAAKENKAYARRLDGIWEWTTTPTPGTANEFPAVTPAEASPIAPLEPTPAGTTAPAPAPEPTTTATPAPPSAAIPPVDEPVTSAVDAEIAVRITECLPNPAGDDSDEWIELYNPSDAPASLFGWQLDDAEGGSRPFAFSAADVVPPHGYLVLLKSLTKLGLNNDGDSVRLIAPDGTIRQAVTYADAPETRAYALGSGGWAWTETPTPGVTNVLPGESEVAATAADATAEVGGSTAEIETALPVDFTELEEIEGDQLVAVSGIVTLPPGRVGKTIFAVQADDGSAGVFVRSYAKELPALAAGDAIEIIGRVRRQGDELRLNAVSRGGLIVTRHGRLVTAERDLGDLGGTDAGTAAALAGTVVALGKNWLVLMDESGRHEIKLVLPRDATLGQAEKGSLARATGVIRFVGGAPTLLVDRRQDLAVEAPRLAVETKDGAKTAAASPPEMAPLGSPPSPFTGLAVASVTTAGAGTVYFLRRRRQLAAAPALSRVPSRVEGRVEEPAPDLENY